MSSNSDELETTGLYFPEGAVRTKVALTGSGRQWTIHDIQVMFHHFCHDTLQWPYGDTPAYQSSIRDLVSYGLLCEKWDNGRKYYKVTDKGVFFIDMLRRTPVPVVKYIDPRA